MKPDDDDKNTVPESIHLEEVETEKTDDSQPVSGGSLEGSSADQGEPAEKPDSSPAPDKKDEPKAAKTENPDKRSFVDKVRTFVKRFDIYLLIFILVTVVVLVIAFIVLNKNNAKQPTSNSQNLSQSALSQLNNNDTQVGNSNQTLNIESNTIFAGNALVKGNLQVAGNVTIASGLNIPTLSVSGNSTINQLSAATITVSGNSTLNGALSVKQNLSVGGTGSFSGSLSAPTLAVTTLQINGDTQISHHITTNGSIPKSSNGSLGSGGTASVNGSDTAGTINIGTGGGISGQNCLVTISFTQAFSHTPHVLVTPVGSASGSINYFINASPSNFTVCGNNVSSGQSISFNYFVID
jgi:hypothetical protein